jgi:phosphate starvation-inducible protein PhoH
MEIAQTERNITAINEYSKNRKNYSFFNLKTVKPLTYPQQCMFDSINEDKNFVADGSAGTGKTYVSLFLALSLILSKNAPQKRLIIVRSIVPSREIGFLPGTAEEKLAPYETPYRDIVNELMSNPTAYDGLKESGKIIFMPTSFIRGLTWEDSVILMDEVQNYNWQEINSAMTRIGENSRVIVVGDYMQTDLNKSKVDVSCMQKFVSVVQKMSSFHYINFTKNDIVRSKLVKEWIENTEP